MDSTVVITCFKKQSVSFTLGINCVCFIFNGIRCTFDGFTMCSLSFDFIWFKVKIFTSKEDFEWNMQWFTFDIVECHWLYTLSLLPVYILSYSWYYRLLMIIVFSFWWFLFFKSLVMKSFMWNDLLWSCHKIYLFFHFIFFEYYEKFMLWIYLLASIWHIRILFENGFDPRVFPVAIYLEVISLGILLFEVYKDFTRG